MCLAAGVGELRTVARAVGDQPRDDVIVGDDQPIADEESAAQRGFGRRARLDDLNADDTVGVAAKDVSGSDRSLLCSDRSLLCSGKPGGGTEGGGDGKRARYPGDRMHPGQV